MTILRWVHKTWNYFWYSIAILLGIFVFVSFIGFGFLQLKSTKTVIANRIEQNYAVQYPGKLSIGRISGLIPYEMNISDLTLYPDSTSLDTVVHVDSLNMSVDVIKLLQRDLVITSVDLQKPIINANRDVKSIDGFLNQLLKPEETSKNPVDSIARAQAFDILVNNVKITGGNADFGEVSIADTNFIVPDRIFVQDINADLFLDVTNKEQFIDINQLSFELEGVETDLFNLKGQLFNDAQFLEFNAFKVQAGESYINFDVEASNLNRNQKGILNQLRNADFNIDIDASYLDFLELRELYKVDELPILNLQIELHAEGDLDSLEIDRLSAVSNEHVIVLNGYLNDILEDDLFYRLNLEQAHIDGSDLNALTYSMTETQINAITNLQFSGLFEGGLKQFYTNSSISGPRGEVNIDALLDLRTDTVYVLNLSTDSLNVGELFGDVVEETSINSEWTLNGFGSTFESLKGDLEIKLEESTLDGVYLEAVRVNSNLDSGLLNSKFNLKNNAESIDAMASVDLSLDDPTYKVSGSINDLDLSNYLSIPKLDSTETDLNFELDLIGKELSELYGKLTMDVVSSVVNGDSLDLHQLYVDLNAPGESRELRLTSTPMDVIIRGDIEPLSIQRLGYHWMDYFLARYESEILLREDIPVQIDTLNYDQINISYEVQAKDLSLIRAYVPDFPNIQSSAALSGNINSDTKNLLFNLNLVDMNNVFENVALDSLTTQITGNFSYEQKLLERSGLDIYASAGRLEINENELLDLQLDFNLSGDFLNFEPSIGKFGEESRIGMRMDASLSDSQHVAQLNEFYLGNDIYEWKNDTTAIIRFTDDDKLIFKELKLSSNDQQLALDGVISSYPEDSMLYQIQNLNLQDFSGLINGRVNFSGTLNGDFSTRTLTRIPSIQGNIGIDGFSLANQVVGDVDINSEFNPELNRFDTDIVIYTDSLKYPDYFIRSDRTGQNIKISGFVNAPDQITQQLPDTVYDFNLEFDQIDMWIFPIIAPKIFEEMEGMVSGDGYFKGNFQDFDFAVDYSIEDAIYFKPRFLETYYYALGDIYFSEDNGLEFDSFYIIDPTGGEAKLSGTYDFNDFSKNHNIDLRLDMEEFQFLNNSFSIDQPFYGDAFGNGIVTMTGTSFAPILTTDGAIQLTDGSYIGIPLLEETEVEQDRRFIQRVDNFDAKPVSTIDPNSQNTNEVSTEINPQELSFIERYTLDMQFETVNPLSVDLIFDPVTGDIITTRGNGRININLEDQSFSMFGRYDITEGVYNFVSGDIITRKFDLNPGGNISWEGAPDNARLNLNAVYRTRPDIRTLSCTDQSFSTDPRDNQQRRQVELILTIGGTIAAIENDFNFNLPNAFDNVQDNTLVTQLNALNNTEDEKLLQATSLLLTNRFVSICSSQDQNNTLTSGLSGSSVVLNPLLSSQVISPLLSNQINSLLRSDVSSLDIDFNLNEFNQVDLGVALRLYNDRLIFRREGQLTGQQSNIGDLGATYRINQTISVTAFHRTDPSFNSGLSGASQQVQDINGLGIEAQIEFDKGNELFTKIGRFFGRLFGKRRSEKGKLEEQITESREDLNDE